MQNLIDFALGKKKADVVIKNVNLVNVCSGEIYETNIAIAQGLIVGVGEEYEGRREIEAKDMYAVPGLIDGHTHIEMSMLSVSEFARAVVPRGTTAVVEDPHEIANVLGIEGIRLILEEAKTTPLKVFCMAPSCVPSTNPKLNIETAGGKIGYEEIKELLEEKEVIGLAEVMDYRGVLAKEGEIWAKIGCAKEYKVPIDGHSPLLRGKELNAYILGGIGSDHELSSLEEALEKLRLGMHLMIREGSTVSTIKNLAPLLKSVDTRNCMLVTDGDCTPRSLKEKGYMDYVLRRAIEEGIDPVRAVQMCTINPATWFHLDDIGSISPGKVADVVLLRNLERVEVEKVLVGGEVLKEFKKRHRYEDYVRRSIRLKRRIEPEDFEIKIEKGRKVRIIGIREGELVTDEIIEEIRGIEVERDILKIGVVERHLRSGNIGVGFVKGFGLKKGAVASSIAHDSHNIIVIGANEEDMALACNRLKDIGGGIVIAEGGEIKGEVALPIAGLMSDRSLEEVMRGSEELDARLKEMGCKLKQPFISMSFLSLPVIPRLKITDRGLVDVERQKIVNLFVS
ncbi:MAG: adenine deaminase [Candidatus Methanospirareceae archaeon]